MTHVTVSGLTKRFGDGEGEILAVDDVNFEVEDGEFIVLVGPSGCGKTTTLRMIGGLETPSEGTIEFDGIRVNDVKARNRDVAMVFQDFALYPHMTVERNLGFGLRREDNDLTEEEMTERIREAAEMLEIEDLLNKRPAELSGGQKQRVALGRAIVREPRVFLLDEPLANLDANLRKTMRTEIDALQSEVGITSLYVTHNQEEAMTMADRIAILDGGELQQIGAPEVVFNEPANTFVATFIGSPNINLFDGSLERSDGGYHVTGGAFDFDIAMDELPAGLSGQTVQLGARPQDLYPVTDVGAVDVAVTGTIDLIEPLGTEAIVRIQTDHGPVTAMVDGYERLSDGDELSLGVDLEEIYLFDANGELLKPRHYDATATDEVTA
jgi:multiple sugar transport system ATP-binding protein